MEPSVLTCKYCKIKDPLEFRFQHLCCCSSCEFKIRKYRYFLKFPEQIKKFCAKCIDISKPCKVCKIIKEDLTLVKISKDRNSKTYDCQYCGDNQENNFIKFRYSTCRNCHNQIRREKYETSSKELKEVVSSSKEIRSDRTNHSKTLNLPEEINNLWRNFYELSQELSLEIQIKNEEILDLKEKNFKLEKEISDIKSRFT